MSRATERGTAVVIVSYDDDKQHSYERRNVTYNEALHEATGLLNTTEGVKDVDIDWLPMQPHGGKHK